MFTFYLVIHLISEECGGTRLCRNSHASVGDELMHGRLVEAEHLCMGNCSGCHSFNFMKCVVVQGCARCMGDWRG
jgi:hypothetical protein